MFIIPLNGLWIKFNTYIGIIKVHPGYYGQRLRFVELLQVCY